GARICSDATDPYATGVQGPREPLRRRRALPEPDRHGAGSASGRGTTGTSRPPCRRWPRRCAATPRAPDRHRRPLAGGARGAGAVPAAAGGPAQAGPAPPPLRGGRLQLPPPRPLRRGRLPLPARRLPEPGGGGDYTGGGFLLVEQRPRLVPRRRPPRREPGPERPALPPR